MSVESLYICTIVLCIDVMMYRYCELSKMSDGGGVGMEDVREVSYVLWCVLWLCILNCIAYLCSSVYPSVHSNVSLLYWMNDWIFLRVDGVIVNSYSLRTSMIWYAPPVSYSIVTFGAILMDEMTVTENPPGEGRTRLCRHPRPWTSSWFHRWSYCWTHSIQCWQFHCHLGVSWWYEVRQSF